MSDPYSSSDAQMRLCHILDSDILRMANNYQSISEGLHFRWLKSLKLPKNHLQCTLSKIKGGHALKRMVMNWYIVYYIHVYHIYGIYETL